MEERPQFIDPHSDAYHRAHDAEVYLGVHRYFDGRSAHFYPLAGKAGELSDEYVSMAGALESTDGLAAAACSKLDDEAVPSIAQARERVAAALAIFRATSEDSPLNAPTAEQDEMLEKLQARITQHSEVISQSTPTGSADIARAVAEKLKVAEQKLHELGSQADQIAADALAAYARLWPEDVLGPYDDGWKKKLAAMTDEARRQWEHDVMHPYYDEQEAKRREADKQWREREQERERRHQAIENSPEARRARLEQALYERLMYGTPLPEEFQNGG